MKFIAVVVLLVTLLHQGHGSKISFSSFTATVALSCYISYPCCSIIKRWACAVDPQTRWTRVRVAVVTVQTAVTRVSVTSPVNTTMTAAMTMKTYVKVSCTLLIHHFVPCQLSTVSVSLSQLVPRLVKAGVVRITTLRTSATATPSAPSTATAAATTQPCVAVRLPHSWPPSHEPYVFIPQLAFCLLFRHLANQEPRCQILLKSWYSLSNYK